MGPCITRTISSNAAMSPVRALSTSGPSWSSSSRTPIRLVVLSATSSAAPFMSSASLSGTTLRMKVAIVAKAALELDQVVIGVAAASGDGMQLTGDRFAAATARVGSDLATLPGFPAEIRAPAGSLAGVSGFQLHFADHDILTPGDSPNVLVAMNPAALKTNLRDLPKGGALIVNRDAFTGRNLEKAGYAASPLEDGSLDAYEVHEVPLTTLTLEALKDVDVSKREAERSKNMFALGLMSWLYHRPTENTIAFLERKSKTK